MCTAVYANPLDEAAVACNTALAAETFSPNSVHYYNLALAQKHADELGQAALSLRRALVLDPHFSEARTALSDLECSQGIASAPVNWQNWAMRYIPFFPAMVTAFGLFWIALAIVIFSSCMRMKIGFGLLAALSLIAFLAGVFSEPRFAWRNDAVIVQATTLSKIPAENSEIIAKLAPATVLTIGSESGSWVFCKLKDGRSGWVQREAIERIVP